MHSWQSGTRYRDDIDVNVLWCHSYLVWLVFEGSIPTCACLFSFRKLFCDLFLFFVFRGRYMICNVQKYRTLLFTKNKVSS